MPQPDKTEFHRHRFSGNNEGKRYYTDQDDGTAKGGIVIAIRDLLGLPVKYIGLGEKEDDLRPFDIDSYLYGLCEDILQHD